MARLQLASTALACCWTCSVYSDTLCAMCCTAAVDRAPDVLMIGFNVKCPHKGTIFSRLSFKARYMGEYVFICSIKKGHTSIKALCAICRSCAALPSDDVPDFNSNMQLHDEILQPLDGGALVPVLNAGAVDTDATGAGAVDTDGNSSASKSSEDEAPTQAPGAWQPVRAASVISMSSGSNGEATESVYLEDERTRFLWFMIWNQFWLYTHIWTIVTNIRTNIFVHPVIHLVLVHVKGVTACWYFGHEVTNLKEETCPIACVVSIITCAKWADAVHGKDNF
ncbi:hypothetical protein B0H21DRAFT_709052 [Amylocystis lapponica]|nr:hypothetical protein B0H21DRAFT_709052 [Amylocystis lapponica]